jgi:hypothetical protein
MKLIKLAVMVVSFLSVSQAALAIGPRKALEEYRGGEFICNDMGPGVKEGRAPAVVRSNDDRREPAANAKGAQ